MTPKTRMLYQQARAASVSTRIKKEECNCFDASSPARLAPSFAVKKYPRNPRHPR
jgi:hypothetical protein